MNADAAESGWLQQQSLDGINELRVECDHLDLTIEADESLSDTVQLVAQPAENVPVLRRNGSTLLVKQNGRYRGRVTPVLRVPAAGCPETGVRLGKGDVSFQHVSADIKVKLGMGGVEIVEGHGDATASLGMGDLAVVNRHGDVALKSGMGDIAVSRCAGAVTVAAGKGDIAVTESGPNVSVRTGSGDIAVVRLPGGILSISSGRGDVSIRDGEATSVSVQTGKGDISSTVRFLAQPGSEPPQAVDDDETSMFDDDDDFDFDFGDIHFEANDEGVRFARGNRDILRLGPEGIRIRGGKREISLGPEGISLGESGEASASSERFTFETARGDIQVSVPDDLNLRVEVLATGDVRSDVPMVSVGRPGPRGTVKRLVGVVDGTGSTSRTNVRVRTRRGDVSIRSMRVQPRVVAQPVAQGDGADRDEQARVILEALARGDLSVNEAERLLHGLDSGD